MNGMNEQADVSSTMPVSKSEVMPGLRTQLAVRPAAADRFGTNEQSHVYKLKNLELMVSEHFRSDTISGIYGNDP
jgi:hypothetical protein